MPLKRNPRRRTRETTDGATDDGVNPYLLEEVNQVVTSMLPTIVAQTVEALRQEPNGGTGTSSGSRSGSGSGSQSVNIHVWYERFNKHKPWSFSTAPSPIDAENWIAHLDKIFEVLSCGDNNKVKLATYKLEGDAARWWKAAKYAKGGDAFVDALSWSEFQELFYEQYFSHADKEAYEREYANIRQHDDESTNEFMARFMRLVGFLGSAAGTPAQQAKKFKRAIKYWIREQIVNFEYVDVAQVANAAKNIEMEDLDYRGSKGESNKKRKKVDKDGLQHQNNDRYPKCTTCQKHHPVGTCYKAIGACFNCGEVGHLAKQCKNPRKTNGGA